MLTINTNDLTQDELNYCEWFDSFEDAQGEHGDIEPTDTWVFYDTATDMVVVRGDLA